MKKLVIFSLVAMFAAVSTAVACGGCGCAAKKSEEKKAACSETKSGCAAKSSCSWKKSCGEEKHHVQKKRRQRSQQKQLSSRSCLLPSKGFLYRSPFFVSTLIRVCEKAVLEVSCAS